MGCLSCNGRPEQQCGPFWRQQDGRGAMPTFEAEGGRRSGKLSGKAQWETICSQSLLLLSEGVQMKKQEGTGRRRREGVPG